MTTATLSSALDGGPDPAFAARIGESVAGFRPGMEAHASTSGATAAASARPPLAPRSGPGWQIQVGAFRNTPTAEAHLRALERAVPELGRLTAVHQLRGRVNRVRIGGIEEEAAARGLCEHIRAAGSGCFVVAPEG
ncbi:MAG TPA: SPOR domain-containing protein [Allosphingosinicella sp.]